MRSLLPAEVVEEVVVAPGLDQEVAAEKCLL
jgi:hypothetical protein